jgi:hypothetical protein
MTYVLSSGTRNASSWAMRAWLALRVQGIEFEERIIELRHPVALLFLAWVSASNLLSHSCQSFRRPIRFA